MYMPANVPTPNGAQMQVQSQLWFATSRKLVGSNGDLSSRSHKWSECSKYLALLAVENLIGQLQDLPTGTGLIWTRIFKIAQPNTHGDIPQPKLCQRYGIFDARSK
ncbi:hypothetical protein DFH06DRAFT_1128138 [Mycena polygramma]|nr:hypothetical protein DFH06DRAFT_1128138 [Mycena polygramma]